ncbi:MAG: transketolase, partial [Nitrospiraceae bacterium]|nr:transketolase [Nitrospiraceae bacterium]
EWPYGPFEIPDDVYAGWDARGDGERYERLWNEMFSVYSERYPDLAREFKMRISGDLPADFSLKAIEYIHRVNEATPDIATRKASQKTIEEYAPYLPGLFGGSADLSCSNLTCWSGTRPVSRTRPDGNYIHYGVREFAMAAIMNGMALHGGFIPYGGTFLVFSDYARNAMRMSALMGLRVIYVLSHDSIGVGEDGPTHQPVEHIASLRLIPGMHVWRPADAVETAVAWKSAIENRHGPTCLVLSRQGLPHLGHDQRQLGDIQKGGYVLREPEGGPEVIVIATGSEVGICVNAAERLTKKGIRVRVVSMPSVDCFEAQDPGYRESVIPTGIPRIAVEAGRTDCWYRYAARVIGLDRFGKSAPGRELFEHFGLCVDKIVEAVIEVLGTV